MPVFLPPPHRCRSVPDRKRILERLGLEGYAAKAYLALLETASSAAKEVAERAGIPKGRIYEVLEELHRRGVVELLPEMPKRYRAVPLPELFDRLVRSQSQELEALKAERSMVAEAFAKPPAASPTDHAGEVVVLREHDLILDRALQALGKARGDVLLVGDGSCVQRLQQWDEVVRATLRRGVKWRLLLPPSEAHRAAVQEVQGWGVEVRQRASSEPATVLLVDDDRALLFRGPVQPRARGEVQAYVFEERSVAKTLRAALEQLWREASPGDDGGRGPSTGSSSPEARGRGATTATRVVVGPRGKAPAREGPRSL